jgi:hypothetical protein
MNRFATVLLAGILATLGAACGGGGSGGGNPPAPPSLSISAGSFTFVGAQGGAVNPAPGQVNITNTGGGTLSFTASSNAAWLSVTPANGTAPQTLLITASASALLGGSFSGQITITAAGATGSPATVNVTFLVAAMPLNAPLWSQWGANALHTGAAGVAGQPLNRILADIVYDPFVTQEKAENVPGGSLTVHYQAPLTDGSDVYMMVKTGTYMPCTPAGAWLTSGARCGPNTWETQIWNEARFSWIAGQLVRVWTFQSDWKPPPNGAALRGWEPVFHPADANGFLYVPGAGGTIFRVNKASGTSAARINPFAGMAIVPANTFVAGPLTADPQGNIYYNVIELADPAAGDPWLADARSAWLVKVTPADAASVVSYATLVPGAPGGVGIQRPGVNIAPAVAGDGTIYTASVAQLDRLSSFLVAVNSDLTPNWAASLQNLPVGPGGTQGSARISDLGSSSPTVLPDGSVVYGTIANINGARGILYRFSAQGNFLASYAFGWDTTPAVFESGGTFSVITKDNFYPSGPFHITQLRSDLSIEWQFLSTNTQSCTRNPDGTLTCVSDHPGGFEWCINMPAVDANGVVYVNGEDGRLYALPQGNSGTFTAPLQSIFLNSALGAAYTPLSLGPSGIIYTQNNGHLFAVGN